MTYHAAYEPQRAVRTRAGSTSAASATALPVLANMDDSPSKDLCSSAAGPNAPIAAEQLYDLARDPNEAANLAEDPACADVLGDLRERLEQWMRDTGRSAARRPGGPPPGAEFNLPDQLSAARAHPPIAT